MTEEEKLEIERNLSALNDKADKIQETLCGIYLNESGHFSHPATCSYRCPFCGTFSLFSDEDDDNIDPAECKKGIAKILAVNYLKDIIK